MAKTASPAGDHPNRLRSDGGSSASGFLGDFSRGPALFSVYLVPPDQSCYPNEPGFFLLDVEDGVGARECCRFTDDPTDTAEWNGAWRGDQWCGWILKNARRLIALSKRW